MEIIKLTLEVDRNWRIDPTETSYHISEEVAKQYAEQKIAEGYKEWVTVYGEDGAWYSEGGYYRHFDYKPNYHLSKIYVNEGEK